MIWNHRVFESKDTDGGRLFAIHEAFYHEKDETPHSWTEKPVEVQAETPEELVLTLERMLEATKKPVLKLEDK